MVAVLAVLFTRRKVKPSVGRLTLGDFSPIV